MFVNVFLTLSLTKEFLLASKSLSVWIMAGAILSLSVYMRVLSSFNNKGTLERGRKGREGKEGGERREGREKEEKGSKRGGVEVTEQAMRNLFLI